MRIDHTIDDDFIQQLIDTAGEYIKSAIDSSATDKDMDNYQQFDLAVSLLTQHWYLNRQEASSERIPVTVQGTSISTTNERCLLCQSLRM